MRNIIYILSTITLLLLQSCYDSNFVEIDKMKPELTTYPAIIKENHIYLQGETNVKSPYLFFQVSTSQDFDEDSTKKIYASYDPDNTPNLTATIEDLIEPGIHYIRVCAKANESGNIIHSENSVVISAENPIKTLEPQYITETSVELVGIYEGSNNTYVKNKYFELSTDPEFKNCQVYRDIEYRFDGNNEVEFFCSIKDLHPATEYYARLCYHASTLSYNVEVKGNAVKFRTEDAVFLDVKSIMCPNTSYELNIFVIPQGSEDYVRGNLRYDVEKESYVLDSHITLLPNTKYNVYIVNSSRSGGSDTLTQSNGMFSVSFNDNGGWRLFYAHTVVDYEHPSVSLEIKELTCKVTFDFPGLGGGNLQFELRSSEKSLPGSLLNLETGEVYHGYSWWSTMIFYNGSPLFMIPFEIVKDDDVIIEVTPSSYHTYKYTMSPVKMEAGKEYYFIDGKQRKENEELDISDVVVNPWNPSEGGSITINP